MRKLALLAGMALIATACLGSDFNDSLTGEWQLASGQVDGVALEPIDSHPVTISLADGGALGGTAACNGYGGVYDMAGSSIRITEIFITEMACDPPSTMSLESTYIGALPRVETVLLAETLSLVGDGVLLVFEKLDPVPDAELTGTVWVLDSLLLGEAVTSVSGERATLEFFTDGSVLGGTGCRTISGQWTISGSSVVLTEFSASGDCSPELAQQDSHVISSLEGGFRVDISGDRMTTWVAGDEGLGYKADG